jgi:GNAT superfamily N-acetyltransferase
MKPDEKVYIAEFISSAYADDVFFEWVVPDGNVRHDIVTKYYNAYLGENRANIYVAEENGTVVGATVWLPHDTDPALYEEIDRVTGLYAPNFRTVADASHDSEPKNTAFTQLVGFAVDKKQRGRGIGALLLKTHLEIMDNMGIPTYLEASTPFHGGGVYGKFGYTLFGDLIVFSPTAVLYPLWRPAGYKITPIAAAS